MSQCWVTRAIAGTALPSMLQSLRFVVRLGAESWRLTPGRYRVSGKRLLRHVASVDGTPVAHDAFVCAEAHGDACQAHDVTAAMRFTMPCSDAIHSSTRAGYSAFTYASMSGRSSLYA